MRIDGIFFRLKFGPIDIDVNWSLWETYCAYEAQESGGRVFIREQRRRVLPKKRRVVTYPKGHPKRE